MRLFCKAGWLVPFFALSLAAPVPGAQENTSGSVESIISWRDPAFDEQMTSYTVQPGIYVTINVPAKLTPSHPTRLIFYALPNGNTTSQTIGRQMEPGLDWHYNIQHIGAQTRRLRELVPNENIITVYLEAEGKSWPSWRKKHPDNAQRLRALVESVEKRFAAYHPSVTLSGHSGGGSFIIGYMNGHERLPDQLKHIAFLDANYAYSDQERHGDKLLEWLKRSRSHSLSVIAYDDRNITLNGKPVVGPDGGTYRATQRMVSRIQSEIPLSGSTANDITTSRGLMGRVLFAVHSNPQNAILHTVLVEKNGFVYSMLCNLPEPPRSDVLFGEVRYTKWIAPAQKASAF